MGGMARWGDLAALRSRCWSNPLSNPATFAGLLLHLRRRAARIPQSVPRPAALEQAVREAINGFPGWDKADAPTRILAAIVGIREGEDFDLTLLDQLTPEAVLQLDLIAGDIIDHGCEREAVRAIRAA